jgi:GntR family transcriptional regulator/GntR family frlABCD operon transcriptional regulator
LGILSVQGTTAAAGNTQLGTRIVVKPEYRFWDDKFYFPISEAEKKAGCVYFERQRIVEGKVVVFEITYLPNIKIPNFCQLNLEDKSLFETLRKNYQIEVKGGEQKISAINPTKAIADKLGIKSDSPVLHLQRKMQTNVIDFNVYSILYCDTSNYFVQGIF